MSEAGPIAELTMADTPHLSLFQKAVTLISWSLAVALFLTVGWSVMRPDDPQGAVSLLSRSGGAVMFLQALILATGAAALVALMAGRYLSEVGTFAAALGLVVVSLRGDSIAALIVGYAEATRGYEQSLALNLALESLAWFVVILLSMIASAMAIRYVLPGSAGVEESESEDRAFAVFHSAAYDMPGIGKSLFAARGSSQTAPSEGLRHTLVATFVGLLTIAGLSAGLSTRMITHGQTCFIVAAGMMFATYVANRVSPVRSLLWSFLAVPLVAIIGLVWAALRPAETQLPAILPSSHYLRILPIQYIAVGTAAIVVASWYLYVPGTESREAPGASPRRPSAATGRSA